MQKLSMLLLISMLLACCCWAQSSDQSQAGSTPTSNTGAAPAMGQEPNPPSVSQFPPLSGLDEASLEPNVAARSFLVFGGQASELIDTNASNGLNHSGTPIIGATHLMGTAGLQRLWERYQVGLDYVGGGAIYAGSVRQNSQVQELNFSSRALWRTGAITLRDSAAYLPDGTYGGSFQSMGNLGGLGGVLGGGGEGLGGANGNRFNFFGANTFGAIGTFPRLTNLAVLDLQQALSPRSAFTLSGGYNLMHFTQSTGGLLIDSRETTAQAGYDYTINRNNKIALIYGFQHFRFPSVSGFTFETNVAQFLYGHQITGRMDLLIGAGPQFTRLSSATGGKTTLISGTGRVSLRYKFPRTSLTMAYDRYNSAAAGFFAGATTDLAMLTVARPLSRRWTASAHVGYSHNKRLQVIPIGVNANSYQAGFAGARVSRIFSRSFSGFMFYGFNELALDRSFCGGPTPCNRTSMRHMVGVGLLWHPRAIRLD